MTSLAWGQAWKPPPPPEKGHQPCRCPGLRLHAGPCTVCPYSFISLFSGSQQGSSSLLAFTPIHLRWRKIKKKWNALKRMPWGVARPPGYSEWAPFGVLWLSIIYWTLIMFLAPPRQKRDKVPFLGASQGRKGQFGQLKKCSIWKDSDTSQLKAALCLYYIFIFNDVYFLIQK